MAVIYLDIDDEITSAASRIRATDDLSIALVLPAGSRVATSRINFRVLAREAQARSRHLSIVAPEAAARALAASAGLTVHATIAEYEAAMAGTREVGLPEPGPIEPPIHGDSARPVGGGVVPTTGLPVVKGGRRGRRPLGRLVAVGLVAVALVVGTVGVAGYVVLPTATIRLIPRPESVGPVRLSIVADPAATTVDEASRVVPATEMSFPLEVSGTFKATGKRVVTKKAAGSVTFISKDPTGTNTVAAGAIVRTQTGTGFVTQDAVTIPRAKIVGLTIIPGQADVAVIAEKGGPSGNVEANTIRIVPADEDPILTEVRNKAATSGGEREEFARVSQEDVDAAMATLAADLAAKFDAGLATAQVPAGTTVFPETKHLGEAHPSVDPATLVDQEVDAFDLGATATGTVTAVAAAPVHELAARALESDVPPGLTLDGGSVEIDVADPIVDGKTVRFAATASGAAYRNFDQAALREAVKGKTVAEARSILEPYGDVEISLWPDWASAITGLDARLDFAVAAGPTPGPGGSARPGSSPSASTAP